VTAGDAAEGVDDLAARRAAIRAHLEHGAPWEACDDFAEARLAHPDDPVLLHLGALAHARAGSASTAHALLDRAQPLAADDAHLSVEILSLRGRLWKDVVHRDPQALDQARRARDEYLAAHAIAGDAYPAVNAATLSALAGDEAGARELASAALARLEREPSPSTWDRATAGEAKLLLGRVDEALDDYRAARDALQGDSGTIATMRRQLALLARVLPAAKDVLAAIRAPDVVAFSGHLIDVEGRSEARFPPALELAVREALRERVRALHAPIVYTSAACGADLIFIEEALDAGAEVNVVLPFARDDFVRTSVAVGGAGWAGRFERALGRAASVLEATDDGHLGDDALYAYAARLLEGLAILRADRLHADPLLLCVVDPDAPGETGGTRAAVERWRARVGAPAVIDLHALRTRHALANPAAGAASRASPPSGARVGPRRAVRSMLFADFTGYSRLKDAAAPRFQAAFWRIAAEELGLVKVRPRLANTWGDALYVVIDETRDAADLALRLVDAMGRIDWSGYGLPPASNLRIGLHAGPIYRDHDPVIGRDNYFGANVTLAARVEPVTPPGMVYATETFAALLAIDGAERYLLEYVGRLALAKGYGRSRIYRLGRV
jgi:hypothetical protein